MKELENGKTEDSLFSSFSNICPLEIKLIIIYALP